MRLIQMFVTLLTIAAASAAVAQPVIIADSGDSAWVLTSSVLTLAIMLPGFALFFMGFVGARHSLSTSLPIVVVTCIVSSIYAMIGYSLIYGDGSRWLGGAGNLGLSNLADIRDGTTVSESVFAFFQMIFTINAATLAVGSLGHRLRLAWVVAFTFLWPLLVYVPVARWMWGGGWLAELGALDFAGGVVVQTSAATAGLVLAVLLGKRQTSANPDNQANPVLVLAGASLLWVGSIGLSGGSTLAASADAAGAMLNTHLAACAGSLVWILIETIRCGKPSATGLATGAVSGLAASAASTGFVGPVGAIFLGSLGSVVAFGGTVFLGKFLDSHAMNALPAFGFAAITGSIAFPFFVSPAFGGPGFDDEVTVVGQLAAQAIAVGATVAWTAVLTAICALMVSMVIPIRSDLAERA